MLQRINAHNGLTSPPQSISISCYNTSHNRTPFSLTAGGVPPPPHRNSCRTLHQHQHRSYASQRQVDSVSPVAPVSIPDLIAFLKEDLQNLFNEKGIDRSKYEDNVVFEDPITRHTSLGGYLLNIQFLRKIFDPTFTLLDIKQTGPYEITTRWAMSMRPTFVPGPARKLWNPSLAFTGTSIMGVNPTTGKFNSHVDTWDALTPTQQRFFSLPAFSHVMSQVFDPRRVPVGLESPPYELLYKRQRYEIRRYPPITVAEAPMFTAKNTTTSSSSTPPSSSTSSTNSTAENEATARPSAGGPGAFGALASYIFGGNADGTRMAMTTPVLSTRNSMQFYLGGGVVPEKAPRPLNAAVAVKEAPGGMFAVTSFAGWADVPEAEQSAASLRKELERDGIKVAGGDSWVLARYNDPGTLPPFRQNEVLLPLKEFDISSLMSD